MHFISDLTKKGKISVSPNDVGADVEWTVHDFFRLSEKRFFQFTSPDFSFSGHLLYFCISPNGSENSNSSGYIDLGLHKFGSGPPISLELSLSIKTPNEQREYEVHCAKDFQEWDSHVFYRFISRSELSRRRSELVPHGTMTVVCTLKDTTSAKNACSTASASANCCYCNGAFGTGSLPSHQQRCRNRPIRCPDCFDTVVFQKWLQEHVCQIQRPEEQKGLKENSQNAGVDASTQTAKDAESLCEVYKKVLLNGRHHDLILKVGGKELRAHRDILRAQSRVFESMLDHDMKEKNSGIIDVPDCDPHAMELFLSYLYCGRIEALDSSNMLELYYVADKYEMINLKRECHGFIKKSLSLTNVCHVIQLALNHSDSDLLEHATVYFADNMLDIMLTVEWQSFLKDNSTVANEILIKSIRKSKNA